jgi:hypothetical protein
VEWWLVVGGRGVGVVDAAIFDLIFDDECRRRASAFKEQRNLLECPSSLSSGVLRGEGFYLLEDKDATASIII